MCSHDSEFKHVFQSKYNINRSEWIFKIIFHHSILPVGKNTHKHRHLNNNSAANDCRVNYSIQFLCVDNWLCMRAVGCMCRHILFRAQFHSTVLYENSMEFTCSPNKRSFELIDSYCHLFVFIVVIWSFFFLIFAVCFCLVSIMLNEIVAQCHRITEDIHMLGGKRKVFHSAQAKLTGGGEWIAL